MREIEGKVVVLGSRGVGKTSLVTRYVVKSALHKDIGPTIGASFFKYTKLLENVKITLQIWDTAGQERFKAVAPMYYRNANAALLVFDLSQYKTFSEIKTWIKELHRNVQDPMILTLVGNKSDLSAERSVSRDEAFLYASSIEANYFETSAETDRGLEEVFDCTARGLVRLADEGKSHTIKQFDSLDSIATITQSHTALDNDFGIQVPSVHVGLPVASHVKANGVGRLERASWSIDHIAFGDEEPAGWCCF